MIKIQTPTITTTEILTEAQPQPSTNIQLFPTLDPPGTSVGPTFQQLLEEYNTPVGRGNRAMLRPLREFSDPFALYQHNLANAKSQPVRWLWPDRLPLAGITLLDGDHSTGKSILALQIAAAVSAGTHMPDGSPTIQGGVILVTPYTDARTTQLQLLTALGADLSRIEILTFIQDRETAPAWSTSGYRPFALPEDFTRLFQAIERVDARLVVFDPFVHLLSRNMRCTNQRLGHLLVDLNQRLIERNIACLLTRTCGAKGRHARPTALERSDHFATIAASRLLLAPDPIEPNRLLLSHALNRHTALTSTLTLQIQPLPDHPDLAHVVIQGTHTLQAQDLIENRPNTLHRQLLAQNLLRFISASTDPVPVATLYTLSPHSGPFQIQRALSDLIRAGKIHRPSRGFYSLAETTSTLKSTTATTLKPPAARKPAQPPANQLKATATTPPTQPPASQLKPPAARKPAQPPADTLEAIAARTLSQLPTNELNVTAATTSKSTATILEEQLWSDRIQALADSRKPRHLLSFFRHDPASVLFLLPQAANHSSLLCEKAGKARFFTQQRRIQSSSRRLRGVWCEN